MSRRTDHPARTPATAVRQPAAGKQTRYRGQRDDLKRNPDDGWAHFGLWREYRMRVFAPALRATHRVLRSRERKRAWCEAPPWK